MVFDGADAAAPAPGVVEAIADADARRRRAEQPVHVRSTRSSRSTAIRKAVAARTCAHVAVSPLVGGRAVKGPLDRMLTRMAGGTSPAHVAGCYPGLIDALVIDRRGRACRRRTCRSSSRDTLMADRDAARRLAEVVLEAAA